MYSFSTSRKKLFILIFSSFIALQLNCSKKDNSNASTTKSTLETTQKDFFLFIGTYTTSIYIYQMNSETGALTKVGTSPSTSNPSYLAIHPNGKWLYCVNENSSGMVSAFSIDTANKKLVFLNSVSSKGDAPCFISVNKSGSYAMAANYNSGSFSLYKIKPDGSLSDATYVIQDKGKGPNSSRQSGPHAHMIAQNPQNCMVYATDLGIDKLQIFNIDSINNKFVFAANAAVSAPGAGPRHFTVHPSQPWVYVLHELKGIIEASSVDRSSGEFQKFQTISTLSDGSTATPGSADIHITPDGKYLYASNRGTANNIAMYSINQTSGILQNIGYQSSGGSAPRNFMIDPGGKFLLVANMDGNNIVTFKIDSSTGLLDAIDTLKSISKPVCLKFLE
jgi:6-phosphogluconolactonase